MPLLLLLFYLKNQNSFIILFISLKLLTPKFTEFLLILRFNLCKTLPGPNSKKVLISLKINFSIVFSHLTGLTIWFEKFVFNCLPENSGLALIF